MSAKVAVIVPVYNMEKYLRECMNSLINQSFHDIEIICFNDASTDSSLDILNEYAAKDERVKIIDSKINIKQGGGRNAGIRLSTAPYIMFVDSDDWVEPQFVEYYYIAAVESGADLVSGNHNYVETSHRYEKMYNCVSKYSYRYFEVSKRQCINAIGYICSGMYKRNLFFENNLFFPEGIQFGEDNAISSALYIAANKIVKLDAPLYNYYIHPLSSCHMKDVTKKIKSQLKTAVMALNEMKRMDRNGDFDTEILHRFLHLYFVNGLRIAIESNDRSRYRNIRYIVESITNYANEDEIRQYVQSLTRGSVIWITVIRKSPFCGVVLYKLLKRINKIRQAISSNQ